MDSIEKRMLLRLYVTLAIMMVTLLPMLLFWDTSDSTFGRIAKGILTAGFGVVYVWIVVRFVRERWGDG